MKKKCKVGLALGSGSARGYAHIGVLDVLEKHLPISMICGSSMGAVVGSIYCCGTDLHMLEKLAEGISSKKMIDIHMPKRGFIKGEKIQELMRILTKDMTFAQTKLPLAVVACDIAANASVVINSGKIAEAVRASLSIPGVFVPVHREGRLLVDGGVLERVPVEPTRSMGADFIIAVDVGYVGEERAEPKNALEVMQYTLDSMGWEIAKRKALSADVVLIPKVQSVPSMRFSKASFFIEQGREAALTMLPEIMEKYYQKCRELGVEPEKPEISGQN